MKRQQSMITFYDKTGKQVGSVERSNCQRMSMQAASDHKKMNAYRAEHQNVTRASLDFGGKQWFTFEHPMHKGQSWHEGFSL